jgi:hypothetical protein
LIVASDIARRPRSAGPANGQYDCPISPDLARNARPTQAAATSAAEFFCRSDSTPCGSPSDRRPGAKPGGGAVAAEAAQSGARRRGGDLFRSRLSLRLLPPARRIAAAILREESARWGAVKEFASMIDTQSAARPRRRAAHLAAAVAVLLALSPAAKAQGLFSFFGGGPSSDDIERRLEASGYELTHTLIRRGDVYLADVAVGRGDVERLVIDAENGRIVQRFRAGWERPRDAAPRAWDSEPFDARDSPPRPPVDVDRGGSGDALDLPDARAEPRAPTGDRIARSGARAISPDPLEKPKPKPSEAKHKTTAPAPAVKAAALTPPEANGAPAAKPPPRAAAADAPGSVAGAASPPPEAPAAPAPTKSKAVNDLPVTPLD